MKKNWKKYVIIVVFTILIITTAVFISKAVVSGNQVIKINTASKAYSNSDLYVSIIAQDNNVDLETKSKIRLLDSKGKKVKGSKVSYNEENSVISIPDVKEGSYTIEARVSSKKGKDKIKKNIFISNGNQENITITFDKGIYKPGDTVNFRALLTSKENDKPIDEKTNILIYDGNDNKVYDEDVQTSEYGIVSGKFVLASEVNSGLYRLQIKTPASETEKQFKVNPYTVPKYEVKINKDKEKYLVGDTANIELEAKYFFGESAKDTKMIVYINNEKYQEVTADENGKANISYEIKEAKKYNIQVEAVDSSNYYVEASSSFSAGTDLFEIQLLPEYGELVANKKNTIYVFTKNSDGTPVKTYLTVTSDKFTKQVATDDNGIGSFSIDIEEQTNQYNRLNNNLKTTEDSVSISKSASNYDIQPYYGKTFNITATNMNNEKVEKTFNLNITSRDVFVSTDKVKYNQGEDIKINTSSITENARNIYIFKNNKLLKMINTESDTSTINLENTYGLIDVYVTGKTNGRYYNNSAAIKRTIFIKPSNSLNVEIKTDKEEYKPGENIKISFGTTDENKENTDAALLVSMLDNSILSLADNDLSIDNIKLALSDITFTDELDAATLYSCIVDDKDEQTLMALLLKQQNKNISVSEISQRNSEAKYKYTRLAVISGLLIFGIAFIIGLVKYKGIRKILKHFLNVAILSILATSLIKILDEALEIYITDNVLLTLAVVTGLSIYAYVKWISKISQKISRTSISLLIASILLFTAEYLSDNVLDYTINIKHVILWVVGGLVALLLIALILYKKNKFKKVTKAILDEYEYVIKIIFAGILAYVIGEILYRLFDESDFGTFMAVASFVASLYFLNYKFNKLNKEEEKIEKEAPIAYVIVSIAVIAIVAISFGFVYYLSYDRAGSGLVNYAASTNSNLKTVAPDGFAIDYRTETDAEMASSGSNLFSDIVVGEKDSLSSDIQQADTEGTVATTETNQNTDTKVRNVFLESMCFVPELVTSNGKSDLDLTLSDNITTWTIQVVGNTKEGRIGYSLLDNVKVFKEFFVDFELPKNLIDGDVISVPVTVYNYTESSGSTNVKVDQADWFNLKGNAEINVNVEAKSSKLVYIPIEIIKSGEFKFKVSASNNGQEDIIEKEVAVEPKGYKVEKVISTGTLDENISEDVLVLENIVENSAKAKVKIYSASITQAIEGMENIFRMPTGCFEQVSSSLYPNILALKYLEDSGIVDEELRNKAIEYISSGYQKILAYEVKGESGGFSLYGDSPAETVLTAYGLMELSDLKEVYTVDENVLNRMTDFLYKKQNLNGSFTITGHHNGGADYSSDNLALNAYIIWALSESNPNDERLTKSVEYLKDQLDKINDNYTLALVANVLSNTKDKELDKVIKRLVNNININGNVAYITSDVVDYYGTRGDIQNLQTISLTSMALSKSNKNKDVNKKLINNIISQKDTYGTWRSTQATILALKAINEYSTKDKLNNQTITVKLNSEEKKIEIKEKSLDIYEVIFDSLNKENKLNINIEKGGAYYEVVEEYYIPFENVNTSEDKIEISVDANRNLKVNEILEAKIKLINKSQNGIYNGMVTISIPKGFTTIEESLMELESKGIIEKYETTYKAVNIYLRDFDASGIVDLNVKFRARYPVNITGLSVRAYDYYNPEVEGKTVPIEIKVNN